MDLSDRAQGFDLESEVVDESPNLAGDKFRLAVKVEEAIQHLDDLLDEGEELARQAWSDSAAMSVLDDRTLMMRLG